jgi:transcriptional regulator with XRE-family HTH domain
LIWDRRRSAGLSRTKLAKLAKLSAATIKFIETARHPPSRASCLRLLEVKELRLTWADVAEVAGSPPKGTQATKTEAPDPVPPQPQPDVSAPAPAIASERQPSTDGTHPAVPSGRLAQTAPARAPTEGPMLTIKIEVFADRSVQILCGPTALRS